MGRIQTTIRIEHASQEAKKILEQKLDKALKSKGYISRAEWLREKIRELINESEGE